MALEVMTDLDGQCDLSTLIDALIQYRHDGYTVISIKEVPHGYDGRMALIIEEGPANVDD